MTPAESLQQAVGQSGRSGPGRSTCGRVGPIKAFVVLASALDGAVLILLSRYFVPSIIAAARKVPNIGSVVVVNVFLGWTFIGWVVALAMAARSVPAR
jgi:hypothetical protein